MGKKRVLLPVGEVDMMAEKYEFEQVQAPHLTGFMFKLFVKLVEAPVIGSLIIGNLRKQNKINEVLRNTEIPETPMFIPEFPPQELEDGVTILEDDIKSEDRVELASKCLPPYDPDSSWIGDLRSFRYWKIRDYAYVYRSRIATPSIVAERIISVIEEFSNKKPPTPLLISFDPEDIRKQAAASTQRFEEGGSTWFHEVRSVKKDAACVSKLRSCGVIFVGKANMHEMGVGTTGNNSNHGQVYLTFKLNKLEGNTKKIPSLSR